MVSSFIASDTLSSDVKKLSPASLSSTASSFTKNRLKSSSVSSISTIGDSFSEHTVHRCSASFSIVLYSKSSVDDNPSNLSLNLFCIFFLNFKHLRKDLSQVYYEFLL